MIDGDPIADALASLEVPPLDGAFAAHVGARASVELRAPAQVHANGLRFRVTVARGLVPALLTLAALVQTAGTASVVAKIYARSETARSH